MNEEIGDPVPVAVVASWAHCRTEEIWGATCGVASALERRPSQVGTGTKGIPTQLHNDLSPSLVTGQVVIEIHVQGRDVFILIHSHAVKYSSLVQNV